MADSAVEVTAGSGTNIDTRTEGTNGNHRQVVVIGDPATNAGVAPVDATNGLSVDVKASALPSGAATAARQDTGNTALSSIQTAVEILDNVVSGSEAQVDIVGALPAGTNAIGKLAANDGVDIGDVTINNASGASAVNIQDGGNTITVDGTVSVTGVATAANQSTQITAEQAIQTSVELIDDTVKADDAAFTPATTKVLMAGFEFDDTTPDSVDEGDAGAARMSANRNIYTTIRDAAGNERGVNVTAGNALTVDGSGVTQPVSNAGLTELAAAINSNKVDVNIVSSDVATGGTSAADDADFIDGTTPGTPAMGVYESTPSTVTDGDLGVVGITQDRQLKVKHTDAIPVTDNGGNLSIDDGGNTITVDGTVAVTHAALTELGSAIDTEVQVDVVGALPAGTNNIGDVDVLSIAAGNNNIGDVDVASIAAGDNNIGNVDIASALPAGTNAIGKLAANSGVDIGDVDVTSLNDGGNSITVDQSTHDNFNANANLQVANTDVSVTNAVPTKGVPSDIDINGSNANHADKYYTNAGAVTDGIVWSPAAGKRWHVLTLYINVSASATVTLEDDLAGGDVARWKGELAANSGVVLTYDKEHPFSSGEDAADLIITTSAGNVYVQAVGYEV